MARLPVVDPDAATGEVNKLFARVKSALGVIPNMTKVMANSPALLDGYLAFAGALNNGKLDAGTRELIAITVAEVNGCEYCLSAHTYIGANVAKLDPAELDLARDAASSDARTQAILGLAAGVARTRGHLDDGAVSAARAAGLTDADIAETVGHVALNVLTNLFNSTARVDNEWPAVAPRNAAA